MSTAISRKKLKLEETIHGKKVTRKQALKGLGRPESWIEFSKKAYEDFQKKPSGRTNDGMRSPPYRQGTSDKNMDRVIGPKLGEPQGGGKDEVVSKKLDWKFTPERREVYDRARLALKKKLQPMVDAIRASRFADRKTVVNY